MKQAYKFIFLGAAMLVSILFLVLAGKIYPALYVGASDAEGYLDSFRLDLVDFGITSSMGMCTVLIPWIMAVVFYYVVNSVHFDRWWHWLVMLAITVCMTVWADWYFMSGKFAVREAGLGEMYSSYMLAVSGWNALFSAAVFTAVSFGIRWWSSNCRHTPFPQ